VFTPPQTILLVGFVPQAPPRPPFFFQSISSSFSMGRRVFGNPQVNLHSHAFYFFSDCSLFCTFSSLPHALFESPHICLEVVINPPCPPLDCPRSYSCVLSFTLLPRSSVAPSLCLIHPIFYTRFITVTPLFMAVELGHRVLIDCPPFAEFFSYRRGKDCCPSFNVSLP